MSQRLASSITTILALLLLGISSSTSANILSDAYSQALTNPDGFDAHLNSVRSPKYYKDFDEYSRIALEHLKLIERQLRQQYMAGGLTSAQYFELNSQITTIVSTKSMVGRLATFIKETKNKPEAKFTQSGIGKECLAAYNICQSYGIPMHKNPEFQKTMQILSSIPYR